MAEQEIEHTQDSYEAVNAEVKSAESRITDGVLTRDSEKAIKERNQAEKKRSRLYEMGWDEALKANKEYDELWAQKEQAEEAIASFRKENSLSGEETVGSVEQEKKEKTLEEQAQVYAEMYDVPVTVIMELAQTKLAEMSEDEKKAFTMLVFSPEGKTTTGAWSDIKAENPVYEWMKSEDITTEGETEEAFVVFARYGQEPDDDTLGENALSALDREKSDKKWMTPKQGMIAREFYRRAEGRQMDVKNITQFPGSRASSGEVPYLRFGSDDGKVCLISDDPEYRHPFLGARQVV